MTESTSLQARIEAVMPIDDSELAALLKECAQALDKKQNRIELLELSHEQVIYARDHYKKIARSLTGIRKNDEFRAQGAELLKSKISEAMDRVALQCKPEEWPYLEGVMLGMQDACDSTAAQLRAGLLPSHYWESLNGERQAYEKFIQRTFGELIDRQSSPDDDSYMAWEMLVGWKVWQHCMITLRDSILRHRGELAVLLRNAAQRWRYIRPLDGRSVTGERHRSHRHDEQRIVTLKTSCFLNFGVCDNNTNQKTTEYRHDLQTETLPLHQRDLQSRALRGP